MISELILKNVENNVFVQLTIVLMTLGQNLKFLVSKGLLLKEFLVLNMVTIIDL